MKWKHKLSKKSMNRESEPTSPERGREREEKGKERGRERDDMISCVQFQTIAEERDRYPPAEERVRRRDSQTQVGRIPLHVRSYYKC